MHKFQRLVLVVIVTALLPLAAAQAQGGGALTPGQWSKGTLSAAECVHTYTFQGKAGEIMLVEALADPVPDDLDPALIVADSGGAILAAIDDIVGLDAIAVVKIPADGEYQVLVTDSSTFSAQPSDAANLSELTLTCDPDGSYGSYLLAAGAVQPLQPGAAVEATIYADIEKDLPNVYVLYPSQAVTWAISFEQPQGDLRSEIRLRRMEDHSFVFDLSETTGARSGTLNVDLDAETLYLLTVRQSFGTFVFEDISIPVKITVNEAQ